MKNVHLRQVLFLLPVSENLVSSTLKTNGWGGKEIMMKQRINTTLEEIDFLLSLETDNQLKIDRSTAIFSFLQNTKIYSTFIVNRSFLCVNVINNKNNILMIEIILNYKYNKCRLR